MSESASFQNNEEIVRDRPDRSAANECASSLSLSILWSVPFSVGFGSNSVATSVWRAPASESGPGIIVKYNPAPRIFAAMYPLPLLWVSQEHDSVLGDRCQRRCYRRVIPAADLAREIKPPDQAVCGGCCIQQAYVTRVWNPTSEDSFCDSPYRTPQAPGAIQIL